MLTKIMWLLGLIAAAVLTVAYVIGCAVQHDTARAERFEAAETR